MFVAVGGLGQPLGERYAGALGPLREVLEVVSVTDVGGVDAKTPVAGQLGDVIQREARAVAISEIIVGQIVEGEAAVLAVGQVAELPAQIDAALAVIDRLGGEVEIGTNVPVVRQLELETVSRRGAEVREQEARSGAAARWGRSSTAGRGWGRS